MSVTYLDVTVSERSWLDWILLHVWRSRLVPNSGQVGYTQTDRQTGRQTDRQVDRQTDKQTDRQTDRQINRQTDRQTDR